MAKVNHQLTFSSLTVLCLWKLISVDAVVNYVSDKCSAITRNYNEGSVYENNLNNLLADLSSKTSTQKFYNSSYGDTPNEVYGLYQCREDLSLAICSECIQNATKTLVKNCSLKVEAIVWYYECMLRYANRNIFSLSETNSRYSKAGGDHIPDYDSYVQALLRTIDKVINQAAVDTPLGHFATADAKWSMYYTLYSLAQCTPDISMLDCANCLQEALGGIPTDYNLRSEVMIFYPSCQLRYDAFKLFYQDIGPKLLAPSPSNTATGVVPGQTKRKSAVLLVVLLISALISILLMCGVWACIRKRKVNKTYTNLEAQELKEAVLDSLYYDLDTLRTATCNFSVDNKLGQGGFGEVYKGKLENGQEIAVKRLSKNSKQGDAEFKTEVILVAKLQHKNLVKLLGFCVEMEEKMLVYEFLPNSSLDKFLWDKRSETFLDWKTRFNIIVGIARGLLYLHEDCPLKVIHRDLKSSNILLDEYMNPKISDFGLAKLFGVDESQGEIKKIVGTYGYMAPEYVKTGHYSINSDVYSFGVIVLEIISGHRNGSFGAQQEEPLRHRAWRLWNEEKTLDIVDATLSNNFPRDEAIKCIHIGLLCIQEDANARPRMSSITAALNRQAISCPMPKPPSFFGTTANNVGDDKIQQNSPSQVYTGTKMITDVYSRD